MKDLNVIITAISSSAVVAAGVSGVITFLLKRFDFKNNYYKWVIQRRLRVYNDIDELLFILNPAKIGDKIREYEYYHVFSEQQRFQDFKCKITKINQDHIWLNNAVHQKLHTLEDIFYSISKSVSQQNPENRDKKLKVLGKVHFSEITDLRYEFEELVKKDFSSLHNVKGFFKLTKK